MLNDLGIVFTESDALIVKLYVVSELMSGNVPEINPVDEFNVTPEGRLDPLARAYVIVESESVPVADKDIATCSLNVPSEPLAVCQTGLEFTYSASE